MYNTPVRKITRYAVSAEGPLSAADVPAGMQIPGVHPLLSFLNGYSFARASQRDEDQI
jgi:hypothetical protein